MIRNRDELVGSGDEEGIRGLALDCVEAGLAAARPDRVVREEVELGDDGHFSVAGESFDLDDYAEILVLGGGKAAVPVASALESLLGERIDRGAVVTDDGAGPDTLEIAVREGDHPIPSERGVEGAREVLELADSAGEDTLVLAVVTGGGSALLPAPAEGVSLADLRGVTDELLASGADIGEINAVRKHLSALKGGRLAERAAPARVVGLVLSDVVGNDLGTIASGPLSPDETTFGDALDVLDRYGIDAPAAVRQRLERGARAGEGGERGEIGETPKSGHPAFERVSIHVLADGLTALDAAAERARDRGFDPLVLSSRVRGEAREAAKTHAAVAEESRASGNPVEGPAVLLSGGETTVTVRGEGVGGPNLEFALSWALDLDAEEDAPVALAAVDTDGRDGGTDAAGALVDAGTVIKSADAAASADGRISAEAAREALADNDALAPLADAGCAIRTGSTGTNVNDLRVLVVGGRNGKS
ncbi:glycerate kinase type-2 family protein [Halorussus ruber]|uniref:glycerate kinase type-2 family protein n=1 Tax=Halorussus ruber TaxID=1126238 RepID=UPI001092E3F7|nr:glycerate kinase [Halorussus ruber]